MTETSDFEIVSTRQQRIAELAKQSPQMGFTSLNHHLDLPWLREAYRRTRKDGAVSRRRRDGTIPWPCFNRLLDQYPLPRAVVTHSVYRRAANP